MSISGEIENCEREIELLETQLAQVRSRLLALLVAQDNTRTIFKSSKEAKLHHTKCQEEIDNQALRWNTGTLLNKVEEYDRDGNKRTSSIYRTGKGKQ